MSSVAAKLDKTPNNLLFAGAMASKDEAVEDALKAARSQSATTPALKREPIPAIEQAAGQLPFPGCGLVCQTVEENLTKTPVYAGAFLGCALCPASKPPYLT